MSLTENERKEKARIFDLLVNNYGVPGRVLNPRNHTNVFAQEAATHDQRDIDEKLRDPETGELSAQALNSGEPYLPNRGFRTRFSATQLFGLSF